MRDEASFLSHDYRVPEPSSRRAGAGEHVRQAQGGEGSRQLRDGTIDAIDVMMRLAEAANGSDGSLEGGGEEEQEADAEVGIGTERVAPAGRRCDKCRRAGAEDATRFARGRHYVR